MPLTSLLLVVPCLFLASGQILAQSGDEETSPEADSSQQVEESEEAYRRRMELESAGDRSDVILQRSSGTLKPPEGMDALPPESQKHLRDELREVIMSQGEWTPEDAQREYPYTPSDDAETDPALRQQEEAAWGELIAEYHEREAAALAGGGRSGSGMETGEPSVNPDGSKGSAGSPSTRDPAKAASSSAAGAGVSQSALEFLKGQQTMAEGIAGRAGVSAENSGPRSGSELETDGEDNQNQNLAVGERSEDTAAGKPPPPGSMAIGDLAALEPGQLKPNENEPENIPDGKEHAGTSIKPGSNSSGSSQDANSGDLEKIQTASSARSTDESSQTLPPGIIAIPELKNLKGVNEEEEQLPPTAEEG